MTRRLLLTALLCCVASISFAQISLRGKIVDEFNRPLPDANVRLENSNIGTTSDNNGYFELTNIPNGKYTLRAARMDYESNRISIESSADDLLITMIPSYLNLNEIVITGTGTHHKLKNAPIVTEVISSKDITNTGALTFENALSSLSSSTASEYGLKVGGLGNKNVLVLVDGKKLAGDTGGDNDLSRIDMSNVKRIEILKGAASSLYGSDAMGGVINIITNTPKNMVDITSSNRISRHGQLYKAANVGLKIDKFSSQTSYQRNRSKGWQLSPYEMSSKGELKETDKQAVTAFTSEIYSQKFTYTPTSKLSLYAKGGYYGKETDRAYSAYSYDMYYRDYSTSVGADWQLSKPSDYIRFDTYFDNYEYGKEYFKGNVDKKKELSKRQRYLNSTLKGVFKIGEYNKFNTGIDFISDYLHNEGTLRGDNGEKSDSESTYTIAAYAQDEFQYKGLTVIPGFRLIHHSMFKNRFTPKVSLMYALDHFNFRASYAAGFRAPNIQELYYEYESGSTISLGNKNLTPEKSNYYSINTEYFNNYVSVSVTGYMNYVKDMIERSNITTQEDIDNGIKNRYLYENLEEARIRGIDVAISAYLTKGITLGVDYSYMSPVNRSKEIRLEGSFRHAATTRINWSKDWSKYLFNVNFNGRLQSNTFYKPNTNKYINNIARTYQLWNLSTTHTFSGLDSFTPTLGLGVENIFNFKDEIPFGGRYATTSPGRTFYVSLILKFKK